MSPLASSYTRRVIDDELDELVAQLPAIAVEGAKAIGKTVTARRRARTSWRLDDSSQLALAAADPDRALDGTPPVLVDEWQRLPTIWDAVRRHVDHGAPAGSYLLTGSAMPSGEHASGGRHSGAGRIVPLRMRPMSMRERLLEPATVSLSELLDGSRGALSGHSPIDLAGYTDELLRSGLPGIRALQGRARRLQLTGYLHRIVDRDFPDELGQKLRSPDALLRWMRAYAAATATTTTMEKIRDAAVVGQQPPARSTVAAYTDALQRLFILDPLPGWAPTRNRLSRLARPPKHHLADPALAARLLGVNADALLEGRDVSPSIPRDGTLLGALFESLVTLSVRVYAQPADATVSHLRTKGGAQEVDLIVQREDGRVLAIEVKLGAVPSDRDVRHLHWLARQIGSDLLDAIVVTTGHDAYRREDGIGVVPLALLGP